MSTTNSRAVGAGRRAGVGKLLQEFKERMRAAFNPLLRWRPGRRDLAEILLIASALPIYYGVRGITQTQVDDAVSRGVDIIRIEKDLGIFWEVQLQSWVLPYSWLVKALNWFYLFGHLPVIGALAVWMYFWHRPQYLLMRNAFLLSGAIALVFYVNFPTAPPRLLPHELGFGFVDTVVQQYKESRPLTPSWFVNEYAAFPSMHIGWNLLVGIALWLSTRNPFLRGFAVIMPLAMFTDIVLTGNHYIIDAFAGTAVMFLGIAIAIASRELVARSFARVPEEARHRGWRPWLAWLCGVPDPDTSQTTAAAA